MPKQRFTTEEIIHKLRDADVLSGQGRTVAVLELCREHGISTATFYKWQSKFGGMDASLMAQMKELEEQNRRLKKLYSEAQIKADIVADALAKNFKSILLMTRRREAPAQVAKRLHAACFKNVQAQGDGPLAQLR